MILLVLALSLFSVSAKGLVQPSKKICQRQCLETQIGSGLSVQNVRGFLTLQESLAVAESRVFQAFDQLNRLKDACQSIEPRYQSTNGYQMIPNFYLLGIPSQNCHHFLLSLYESHSAQKHNSSIGLFPKIGLAVQYTDFLTHNEWLHSANYLSVLRFAHLPLEGPDFEMFLMNFHHHPLIELELLQNAISPDATMSICLLIKNLPFLKSVIVRDNTISADMFVQLIQGITSSPTLEALSLNNQDISLPAIIETMSQSVKKMPLKELSLKNLRAPNQVICSLFSNLMHSNIEILDLSQDVLDARSITCLAQVITKFSELKQLNLAGTRLGLSPGSLEKIIDAVSFHQKLQVLDLGGNVITDEMVPKLTTMLLNLTQLTVLRLEDNPIHSSSVQDLLEALENVPHLKYLSLSPLISNWKDMALYVEPLKQLKSLVRLEMSIYLITQLEDLSQDALNYFHDELGPSVKLCIRARYWNPLRRRRLFAI